MKENLIDRSSELLNYYSSHRINWEEFYPSEKWVFERLAGNQKSFGDVLDVGCAAGGLGQALCAKFSVKSYTGVDINREVIEWARQHQIYPMPVQLIHNDITKLNLNQEFDMVVSLSCADFSLKTQSIIESCWDKVGIDGYFVLSLRLTTQETINDISKSYQRINFSGKDHTPELANYAVFNHKEAVDIIKRLNPLPSFIGAYGYWGVPSNTAITPFERILFTVFYLRKSLSKQIKPDLGIHWPEDVSLEGI